MTLPPKADFVPVGHVAPHAPLLNVPADNHSLYKIMRVENLLNSIDERYLYFNRVDRYRDFKNADQFDGEQLPQDRLGNAGVNFLKAPDYSIADYYDQARARTYAFCLSLENSDFIWKNYGNGGAKGKVCLVFEFGKLRDRLNKTIALSDSRLSYKGEICRQIFSINHGIVDYVDWDRQRANAEHLPNPIKYTYLKGSPYCEEREFRVSLSAFGLGHFALNDGNLIEFHESLRLDFDFVAAFLDGTIKQILYGTDTDTVFLHNELQKRGGHPGPGSDLR